MQELHIAEIPFADGRIRYRYARRLSADGTRWVRHGLFQAFHPNGTLASEGTYHDGVEDGWWQDFHANGQRAAAGTYHAGGKAGPWRYWNEQGTEEVSDQHPAG